MNAEPLPPQLLKTLAQFDTPTICNALEIVAPHRRTTGFTTRTFVCADPALVPMVGYARTATMRALDPSPLSKDEQHRRRLDYYAYVAQQPGPAIVVMQDLDPEPGFGAFWGEVNSTIHKGLGCLGVVTNGSFRDLGVLAPGFQLLGGKLGPSHAYVHAVDFSCQVNVFGMTVSHNDLLHADRHGAVVIPLDAAPHIPRAVELCARREAVILDTARRPGFDLASLRAALEHADEIH
ncbi:RraA family protein [bacterium]|nr:MAG: RraA family protein [bacterium]